MSWKVVDLQQVQSLKKFANDGDYKTAAIFQMLRDSSAAYQELLENLTVVTKEDE